MVENNQISKKKNSGLIIFLLLIIILAAVLAGVFVYFRYIKNEEKNPSKAEFIEYLGKGNLLEIINVEKINSFYNRVKSEPFVCESEISGIMSGEDKISDIKLNIDSKNDFARGKSSADFKLSYKDNEIISLNLLNNNDKIGIISEDIVIKYLGSKYENLSNVLNKIIGVDINFDFKNLKSFNFPVFTNEILTKYLDIINQKATDSAFSSKNVILDGVKVTEYSLKLTESQAVEIFDRMLRTLEEDDAVLSVIFTENENKEKFKSMIEEYINAVYSEKIDDSKIYTIKVYGANNILYKTSVDFYGESSFEIVYNYGENNNSALITILNQETQSGYSFEISKKVTGVSENLSVSLNSVVESEIVGKIELMYNLVSSGNNCTLKCKVDSDFSSLSLALQANSTFNFEQVSIEDLTEENCLFMDELNEEQFNYVVDAVTKRATEVLEDRLIKFGLKEPKRVDEKNLLPANINTETKEEVDNR